MNELILCLQDNIFELYTKNNSYYETKDLGFPLYDSTKKYFESSILQTDKKDKKIDNSNLYKKYFNIDLIVALKNEYDLKYCYSSRLNIIKDKREISPEPEDNIPTKLYQKINSEHKRKNTSENNSIYNTSTQDNSFISQEIVQKESFNNIEMNLENIDLDQTREETKEICIKIKEYNHSFKFVKENITIANPRNFFLKNIISDIFKDLMFKNKSFINIKKIYATKYGKKVVLN